MLRANVVNDSFVAEEPFEKYRYTVYIDCTDYYTEL